MNQVTFVYVVVDAQDQSAYADLTIISSLALRHFHPDAQIVWLTDRSAADFGAEFHSKFDEYRIGVRDVAEATQDPLITSRLIKTQMRQLIEGEFMFLDADTLPICKVDHLFEGKFDLAMAWDVDGEPWAPWHKKWSTQLPYRQLGWRHNAQGYFNSGVSVFKDTQKAHEVGELWHRLWQEALAKCDHVYDQPSLNYALYQLEPDLRVLHAAYNAIIGTPEEGWREGAKILHFCCSNYDSLPLEHMVFYKMLATWKRDHVFDTETFLRCVETENPFLTPEETAEIKKSDLRKSTNRPSRPEI